MHHASKMQGSLWVRNAGPTAHPVKEVGSDVAIMEWCLGGHCPHMAESSSDSLQNCAGPANKDEFYWSVCQKLTSNNRIDTVSRTSHVEPRVA